MTSLQNITIKAWLMIMKAASASDWSFSKSNYLDIQLGHTASCYIKNLKMFPSHISTIVAYIIQLIFKPSDKNTKNIRYLSATSLLNPGE